MDYRTLLKKYIEHVIWEEGFNYIDCELNLRNFFTEEEWNELKLLAKEVDKEGK